MCFTILKLYNEGSFVVEPAGALSVAALKMFKEHLIGETVVCIVSGSNNDIIRMQEIIERSLLYVGLKYYFLVCFPQRAGSLRHFVNIVPGPDDDITRFDWIKKNNRKVGPALVNIEMEVSSDYAVLLTKTKKHKVSYPEVINHKSLFEYLI